MVASWFSSMMFLGFLIALLMWLWVGSPLRFLDGYFDCFVFVPVIMALFPFNDVLCVVVLVLFLLCMCLCSPPASFWSCGSGCCLVSFRFTMFLF